MKPIKYFLLLLRVSICLLLIPATSILQADNAKSVKLEQSNIQLEQVARGLGIPWGMTWFNDSTLLFSERAGKLSRLDLDTLQITPLSGLPSIASGGQGGLLDIAMSSDASAKNWIYLTYSKLTESGAVTTLARARYHGDILTNWQDLLISDSATDTLRHFGSRIAFDGRGHVFFSIGDRGVRQNAQDLNNHAGSIIRLNLDGSIPKDNPFVGQPGRRAEIWSYGHRNPQGLVFDHKTDRLWAIEHGPRGGDEINLIEKGRNYGWPVISYGKEYWGPITVGEGVAKAGMEQPVKTYIPSIAPGSLILYDGAAFPQWQGNLFAGALKLQHINRIIISTDNRAIDEERLLTDLGERIRALIQSDEGWIYLSTDSGKILRLRPGS